MLVDLLGVTGIGLAGGFLLKDQCTRHAWDGFQYRRFCYNDPQYVLWVLPFFVVLSLSWQGFAVLALTDVAVWAAISSFFLATQYGEGNPSSRLILVDFATLARYVVLGWLLWQSRSVPQLVVAPKTAGRRVRDR